MPKELGKQHAVVSSNLESIGFYPPVGANAPIVRVTFKRGASYDYWSCTEREFQLAFAPGAIIKDWFHDFKIGKAFKKLD